MKASPWDSTDCSSEKDNPAYHPEFNYKSDVITIRFSGEYPSESGCVELGRSVIEIHTVLLLFDISELCIAVSAYMIHRQYHISKLLKPCEEFFLTVHSISISPGCEVLGFGEGFVTLGLGIPLDTAVFINKIRLLFINKIRLSAVF